MRYEGAVYRPPSEARSLIIQVTIGCSHNKCTFCSMYKDEKFRVRSFDEIKADLMSGRRMYARIRRIFLADGDALIVKTQMLLDILACIRELFPECERVGIYATPADILRKSENELRQLKEAGLGIFYIGIESGDDEILEDIRKGVSAQEMIEAGRKAKKIGIPISLTLISGIGGLAKMRQHAENSARVISEICPEYASFLTLMLVEGTDLHRQYENGEFQIPTPNQAMEEMRIFLEKVDAPGCVFRANHASNYVALAGVLNQDRERLIAEIDEAFADQDYKPEYLRGL
ncbi:MAG: radical SAM protein [Peptostreptococcaceae bacterium]|nr:radical SAM protein [Peptostreptococcaceae bacterium]